MCSSVSKAVVALAVRTFFFSVLLWEPRELSAARVQTRSAVSSGSYDVFRRTHRGGGEEDAAAYALRRQLFESRRAQVDAHNARGLSWTERVNRFADFTSEELGAMLGYKRVGGRWAQAPGPAALLELGSSEQGSLDVSKLAAAVDWRVKLNSSNFIHNQGACGSCWAHAAVAALEAHSELQLGASARLATQQIVDCTANPRHCGGTGGCHGATAELAFEHARVHGIADADKYSGGGRCREEQAAPALKVQSFVRLPENKGSHLLHALAHKGPVAISVDAENFFMYNGGVFAGCTPDTVVNHAVLAVGYGTDAKSGKDYYLIKNSWGPDWGEEGYMRIERHTDDNAYCGVDRKPKEGVYCDDAPPEIRVCGMCGITSDSAYPILHKSKATPNVYSKSIRVPRAQHL